MGRSKKALSRADLEKYPLERLRTLLKEATEIERAKAKAEKLQRVADAARVRQLIGDAVLATFPADDLKAFLQKVIPPNVTDPKDLALFAPWLNPAAAPEAQ